MRTLEELLKRGAENGVKDLELIDVEKLRSLEPNVSPQAVGALHAPTSAICDPYGLVYGAMENAVENGVSLELGSRVVGIEKLDRGFRLSVQRRRGEIARVFARCVVNAAGSYADELNNMVSNRKLRIEPRRGDYCLYENRLGRTFTRTMFQPPSKLGKGVLVTPTIHGNLLIGPSADAQESRDDVRTTAEGLASVLEKARRTWPEACEQGVISTFAGIRASNPEGDFMIGEAEDASGFFNVACLDSPGLTAAPAIAVDVAKAVASHLDAPIDEGFDPKRVAPRLFAMMDNDARAQMIAEDERYARVVCRCCNVTEGELVEAMRRPVPALTLDALKWRTGASMGPCHGGACAARMVDLMARELGVEYADVVKRGEGSHVVARVGGQPEGKHAAVSPKVSDAYDLVVVGGGVSGMAAALNAYKAGVESILAIDRDSDLGGMVGRLTNPSFGMVRFGEMIPGTEFARRERAAFAACDADVLHEANVLGVEPAADERGAHVVTYAHAAGVSKVRARAVVIAVGGREHGAGELVLAGSRPAGVFTAGSASAFANQLNCTIGTRAVVYGIDSGAAMAATGLKARGIEVVGVFLGPSDASVLKPGVEGFLASQAIPLHFGRKLVSLEGKARLEAVCIASCGEGEAATARTIECDTLVVSIDSAPETALAEAAGASFDEQTRGVVTGESLCIGIPGIFVCGNGRRIHDGADFATADGEAAGRFAADYLNRF